MIRHIRLIGTTDTSGDATIKTDRAFLGKLLAVEWVDGDLADNNTAVLSCINTPSGVNQTLHTQAAGEGDDDAWWYPRIAVHDNSAVGVTYDGTNEIYENAIVNGQLQLVIASGGSAKTGGCIVYLEE